MLPQSQPKRDLNETKTNEAHHFCKSYLKTIIELKTPNK